MKEAKSKSEFTITGRIELIEESIIDAGEEIIICYDGESDYDRLCDLIPYDFKYTKVKITIKKVK